MPNPTSLLIKIEWRQVQTDLSNCETCGDTIYSGMWQLFFLINDEPIPKDHKICNSCHELINDRSGET